MEINTAKINFKPDLKIQDIINIYFLKSKEILLTFLDALSHETIVNDEEEIVNKTSYNSETMTFDDQVPYIEFKAVDIFKKYIKIELKDLKKVFRRY